MLNEKLIQHLGDGIRREFRRLGAAIHEGKFVSKLDMDELSEQVEAFVKLSESTGLLETAAMEYEEDFETLCHEYASINEGNRYGFFNPFDDMVDSTSKEIKVVDNEDDDDYTNGVKICKISMYRSSENDDTFTEDVGVFANKSFFRGNTVEMCNIDRVDKADLHARVVRDNVFPIDPKNGIYGIPRGHGLDYRDSYESGKEANIDYVYDERLDKFRIYAIKTISKGDELVMKSDETHFENEMNPRQFKYKQGVEPYLEIRGCKIV